VCGVTGWFRRIVLIAGAVVVLDVTGCSGDGKGPVDPPVPSATSSAASVAPTASPTGTVDEQILAQYRRFWTETLPAVFAATPDQRRHVLEPVAADPLLPELLRLAREFDDNNEVASGSPVVLKQMINRRGREVIVFGCLDMRPAIRTDSATGRVTYRGKPRDPNQAYFRAGADGTWRVYALDERPGSKC
jgi:hypothetical protein